MQLLLGCMGWVVTLAMASNDPTSKLELIFSLLLTSVAFKFAVTHDLPQLPHLTALDKYVLGSFMFLFGNGLQVAVTGAMVVTDSDSCMTMPWRYFSRGYVDSACDEDLIAAGLEFDKWASVLVGVLWVLFQVYSFRFMMRGIQRMSGQRKENKLLSEQHKKIRKSSIHCLLSGKKIPTLVTIDDPVDQDPKVVPTTSATSRLRQISTKLGKMATLEKIVVKESGRLQTQTEAYEK
jgi:hypothetical protein